MMTFHQVNPGVKVCPYTTDSILGELNMRFPPPDASFNRLIRCLLFSGLAVAPTWRTSTMPQAYNLRHSLLD